MSVANDQDHTVAVDDPNARLAGFPEEIKQSIQKLTWPELSKLMTWFDDYFQAAWDRQMEKDFEDGKFDRLAEQALDDLRNGRCTPL